MDDFTDELARVMREAGTGHTAVDSALADVRRRAAARRRTRTVGVVAAAAASVVAIVGVSLTVGSGDPVDVPLSPATEAPGSGSGITPTIPEATDHLHVAGAFVEFAKGRSSNVPWAEEVIYFISGEEVARLSADQAIDASAWDGCPAAGFYAARDCPVSPITPVAWLDDGDHVYEADVPEHFPCSLLDPPAELDHAGVIVIRPPQNQRDCLRDFAVSLYVDDRGDVVGLDLVLAEP